MLPSPFIARPTKLRVVLASNFVRDERFGTSKVQLRIALELEHAGAEVSTVFSDDLPRVRPARLAQFTSVFRMALSMRARAAAADVVDIAGFDAWAYARWARRRRPRQLVVSRSNGLWCRSQSFKGGEHRSAWRQFASERVQAELCRWERASIEAADVALFGARSDADYVIDRGWKHREHVAVVSPGVDDVFESSEPLESRFGVFYVGSYLHQKGGDVAADALALVLARRPDATMTFVGPAVPPNEIRRRFPADVRTRVHIVDKVPAVEVAKHLHGGAILMFPALYEGFGIVVLEAMRAGLVVVATPTGAGAEVIRDGVNGISIPFGDVAAAAAAVERLLDEPALRVRLAAAAVNEARARGWTATAKSLIDVYEDAIARLAIQRV